MLETKLRVFQLRVFRFKYSAKWKARSWKTSEFDQCLRSNSEAFSSGFSVLGMVKNGKLGEKNLISYQKQNAYVYVL